MLCNAFVMVSVTFDLCDLDLYYKLFVSFECVTREYLVIH